MSPPASDVPVPTDPPAPRKPRWRGFVGRLALPTALVAVALAAYWGGLPQMLSPGALGRGQVELRAAAAASPVLALTLYVLAYAVLTGACLPVALMLSLLGGAIFGVWTASVAVLLGATGGAVLTYAAARSAFAPFLLGRAERDPRLQKLIDGFGRGAFSYILTLRLIPLMPFALVNAAAGLAAVPLRAFTLATLAGGVPTALIYAGLGAGLGSSLGSKHSLEAALHSPRLLLPLAGLALLSLVPTLVKRLRRLPVVTPPAGP